MAEPSARFEIKGLGALEKKIKRLRGDLRKKIVTKAAKAGGKVIRDRARDNAPVGSVPHMVSNTLVQPGNLRKNILMKTKTRTSFSAAEVTISIGPGKIGFYGQFVELGTKKMGAQPFLRPAFDSEKRNAVEKFKGVLEKYFTSISI